MQEGLNTRHSRPMLDFFRKGSVYFNSSLEAAVDKCTSFVSSGAGGVIMIFNFEITSYVSQADFLAYSSASDEWQRHVKHCRSKLSNEGRLYHEMLEKLKAVSGPICRNPTEQSLEPLYNWQQLAVSDNAVLQFDISPTIVGVIEIVV